MKYVSVQHNGLTHVIPFSEVINNYRYLFVCDSKEHLNQINKFRDRKTEIKIHFKNKEDARGIHGGVGDWQTWKNWADVIVFCGESLNEKLHQMKREGYYCTSIKSVKKIIAQDLKESLSEAVYKGIWKGCNNG